MTETQKEKLTSLARSLIGRPYKYGAKTEEAPNFFDCSLFTQYVFKQIGINIPRSTIEQAAEGQEVKLADLEAGDLIFTHSTHGHYNPRFPQGIGHVGIFLKGRQVIHASSARISEKPIVENGGVKEEALNDFIEKSAPVIIIKRYA